MWRRSVLLVAVLAIAFGAGTKIITAKHKDGTAQGVAKIRHYEALQEPSKRLYHDPYASYMYPGSFVQTWLGEGGTRWLYNLVMKGTLELLTTRTKWIDEEVIQAFSRKGGSAAEQLIILGAGYDTRGFRLDFAGNDFCFVLEVDQPDVQTKKLQKLKAIAQVDEQVAFRMKNVVKFVSVDFNANDSLSEKLLDSGSFSSDKVAVATLEGVSQYIPKTSTADTLSKLHSILAPQSTLLISYVPQDVLDNPPSKSFERMLTGTKMVGEEWISGWTPQEFDQFLTELGYDVVSDTTMKELNDRYLVPLNRGLKEDEILPVERYVVATIRKGKEQSSTA